jgi:histidyl-tRNA synthetase
MKSAGRSGAAFAIIVGDRDLDEGPDGTAQLKDLNTGGQTAVAIPDLVSTIQGRLQ